MHCIGHSKDKLWDFTALFIDNFVVFVNIGRLAHTLSFISTIIQWICTLNIVASHSGESCRFITGSRQPDKTYTQTTDHNCYMAYISISTGNLLVYCFSLDYFSTLLWKCVFEWGPCMLAAGGRSTGTEEYIFICGNEFTTLCASFIFRVLFIIINPRKHAFEWKSEAVSIGTKVFGVHPPVG